MGELCQGTGSAFCTDGRFRSFGAPTRRFVIDLGGGDDELVYDAASGHSGEEPEGEIRLGDGDDELESSGLERHTVDAGARDDTIELGGSGLGSGGGIVSGSAPAGVVLEGGLGADTFAIAGRRSGDTVLGGPGLDSVSYAGRAPAVTVTLDGSANDGTGDEGDDLQPDVEELIGTAAADSLTGTAGDQVIDGGLGSTRSPASAGPGGAADLLTGDAGSSDTADYRARTQAVVVTLPAGGAEALTLDGDRLVRIANVFGGSAADRLLGNALPNELRGGLGNDKIDGRGGDDRLLGDGGRDVIGALRPAPFGFCQFVLGEGQVCTLDFFVANPLPDGRDRILGGADADTISSRDLASDRQVFCGGGADGLRRDAVDDILLSCESVVTG